MLSLKKIFFLFLIFTLGTGTSLGDVKEFKRALVAEGLSPRQAQAVYAKLGRTFPAARVAAISEWLVRLGISEPAYIIIDAPNIMGYKITDNLDSKVEWFRQQGVKDVALVIKRFPKILGYSIERTLEPRLRWLKAQGIQDVSRLITAAPATLVRGIDSCLEPRAQWLRSQGVTEIGDVVTICPTVFGLSIETNLQPKIDWLRKQGVTDVGRVLVSLPTFFNLSIRDNLDPKAMWLRAKGFPNPGAIITKFSPFLSYNIASNLEPTFQELNVFWETSIPELETSPTLLGASLPRIQQTRRALDLIAQLAGSSHFDFSRINISKKKLLIQGLSEGIILRNLKQRGIIRDEVVSLVESRKLNPELNAAELSALAHLYTSNELQQYFVRAMKEQSTHHENAACKSALTKSQNAP